MLYISLLCDFLTMISCYGYMVSLYIFGENVGTPIIRYSYLGTKFNVMINLLPRYCIKNNSYNYSINNAV